MEIAKNAGITYKQTPVANGTLVKVIKAAMASHLEDEKGWNYYVSKSKEAIAELAESGENAAEVKDAPAVIVPVYAPAKEAPMEEAQPAISSSHCTVVTPKLLCLDNSCSTSVAGVIGYDPKKSRLPAFSAAAINPYAVALLPMMSIYLPGFFVLDSTL